MLAWDVWDVTWRELVVLDRENRPVAIFSVSDHNLQQPTEYEALRDLLIAVAEQE